MLPKFVGSRSQEEFLSLARAVQYPNPKPLERRALPVVLQGKDVVVETGLAGATGALLLLPLLLQPLHAAEGVTTLVIASSAEAVRRLSREFRSLAAGSASPPRVALVGIDDNIRKELQFLGKSLDALIATPERLIDHIRRDNLKLSSIRRVVVEFPRDFESSGFDKDLLFVFSKLGSDVQTFVAVSEGAEAVSLALPLHHPQLIKRAESERPACRAYRLGQEQSRPQTVADLFYAERLTDVLVICPGAAAARMVHEHLLKQGILSRYLPQAGAPRTGGDELAQELEAGTLEAVAVDSCEPAFEIQAFSAIVYLCPPEDSAAFARAGDRLSGRGERPKIFVLYSAEEEDGVRKIEEVQRVDMSDTPSNEEVLKGRVNAILKRIRENDDPAELKRYRRMIRRSVPLFFRGSFAAFLLRESLGKQTTARAPSEMKTLFVSIGKNRRVFPRDLSRLFASTLEIKPTLIGPIKVLDNYSFVDVPQDLAEKAIGLLDAKDFRGRKITVNYARKRDDVT